jgi:hypothetical protein
MTKPGAIPTSIGLLTSFDYPSGTNHFAVSQEAREEVPHRLARPSTYRDAIRARGGTFFPKKIVRRSSADQPGPIANDSSLPISRTKTKLNVDPVTAGRLRG